MDARSGMDDAILAMVRDCDASSDAMAADASTSLSSSRAPPAGGAVAVAAAVAAERRLVASSISDAIPSASAAAAAAAAVAVAAGGLVPFPAAMAAICAAYASIPPLARNSVGEAAARRAAPADLNANASDRQFENSGISSGRRRRRRRRGGAARRADNLLGCTIVSACGDRDNIGLHT